jgi:hypothetical protein
MTQYSMTHERYGIERKTRVCPAVRAALLLLAAGLVFGPRTAAGQSVWPLTPYNVRILVAVESSPPLSSGLEAELCDALRTRIESSVGAVWNFTLETAPAALHGAMLRDPTGLQASQIPLPPADIDKILLLSVTTKNCEMRVVARDFDVRTRMLGAPVVRPLWQVGALCDASFDALWTAFAPLARMERLEKDSVLLRTKASGLPLGDPRLALLKPGDVFQPVIRRSTREGDFLSAAPAQWSFFIVDKISPEETRCRLETAMRGALSTRGRGRIEALALRVTPPGGSTTLVLKSRTEPVVPLAGYDVYTRVPGEKAAEFVGRTDRRGRFIIKPSSSSVQVILIKNGREPLLRLPIVPGLEREIHAEAANDDHRLKAEGIIYGLQEELVDLKVRRETYMMRLRRRLDEGDLEEASRIMEQLQKIPTATQFNSRVDREADRLETPDFVVQRKVNLLMNDTRALVTKHLDPVAVEELSRELYEAKEAARRRAAAPPPAAPATPPAAAPANPPADPTPPANPPAAEPATPATPPAAEPATPTV